MGVQAPRDKLVCVLNCCRVINNLLHAAVAAGEARGAICSPLKSCCLTAALLTVLVHLGQGAARVSAYQLRARLQQAPATALAPVSGAHVYSALRSVRAEGVHHVVQARPGCLSRRPRAHARDAHQARRVLPGRAAGADDFLPVLIFVVVHAAPPQLASNLEYVQRFRMQSRMASESAYFFTQLVRRPVRGRV